MLEEQLLSAPLAAKLFEAAKRGDKVVIGGDGSMRAAHMIWTRAQRMHAEGEASKLSVVAIPKTMDNDILWVWQSFGFMSAVEKAKQFVHEHPNQ